MVKNWPLSKLFLPTKANNVFLRWFNQQWIQSTRHVWLIESTFFLLTESIKHSSLMEFPWKFNQRNKFCWLSQRKKRWFNQPNMSRWLNPLFESTQKQIVGKMKANKIAESFPTYRILVFECYPQNFIRVLKLNTYCAFSPCGTF